MKPLHKANFRIGLIAASVMGVILLGVSRVAGKVEFFLFLNHDFGRIADGFLGVWTNGGDGLVWIGVLLLILFGLKRKDAWLLALFGFVFSTAITQVCKYWIYPGEPRPATVITDHSLFHSVPWIGLHTISSFPSGHTGTACCIYLVLCLLIRSRLWVTLGFLYVLLVGYSRIYLAQHFPVDVGTGLLIGAVSAWLSLVLTTFLRERPRRA